MNVEPYKNIENLAVPAVRPDLRRDLHVFVSYLREREVKRSHRGNGLSKTDARRLAKLMSDPNADDEIVEQDCSRWIDYVDKVALKLGFVNYDIKGSYAGYHSQEPSFPDNFIELKIKVYDDFLRKSLAQQESQLLETLSEQYTANSSEFFSRNALETLDRFSSFGSATGVIPLLDFPKARRFLLKLLAELPTGEWLSTASFIALLEKNHRYFLIPANPEFKNKWEKNQGRYGNFHEGHPYEGPRVSIKPSDRDSFARVEGRYVERFLEGIPNVLGYVDVGYAKGASKVYPSLGALPAFRVSERLRRALDGKIAEPSVRVTSAFEVYVQSEVYPARVLAKLGQVGELVSADTATVYRLTKQKIAAAKAAGDHLDPLRMLESLSTTTLPDNVRREIAEWSEHSEKFVLFSGFSLLETERDVAVPERYQVECIDSGMYIVRSPEELFNELEQQERMPVKITHNETAFAYRPDGVRSVLGGKARKAKNTPADRPRVTLMKVTRVQLLCPDRDFLQRLQNALLGSGCPVEADVKNLSLVYSDRYEPQVGQAIRGLKNDYQVTVENKG